MREKLFLILFFIFVLIFLSVFYYFQVYLPKQKLIEYQKELEKVNKEIERLKKFDEEKYAEKVANILSFENFISTTTDIQLEGVEIIPKGDRKLVINHAEGYQIEIPNNLILNQSKSTTGLHFDDLNLIKEFIHDPPKFWTVMSIFVFEKDEAHEVFEETWNSIKGISREGEYGGVIIKTTSTSTKIDINGEDFYKIKHIKIEDGHETIYKYEYVIFKGNKLYSIFAPPSEEFEQKYIKTFKFIKKNE
ncbi:MAG: hypothetical protein RQ894_00305 [Candidatus Pacebacteria bacterium]|jgi:effector-binding domain-containing protein|nr:hypothetical protein [Candidatus Paceibacterota bacterium]